MEFTDVIRSRRTVRKFKSDPIPEEVMAEILEAGQLAPSGMNDQRWSFGLVTDEKLKQELVSAAGGQEWIVQAPVILALCVSFVPITEAPDDDTWLFCYRFRQGAELVDALLNLKDQESVGALLHVPDVMIAGQQMMLAAENRGVRGCWIGYLDIAKTNELLKLPEHTVCPYLIPIGYPDETPAEIERKALTQLTFRNTWGESII